MESESTTLAILNEKLDTALNKLNNLDTKINDVIQHFESCENATFELGDTNSDLSSCSGDNIYDSDCDIDTDELVLLNNNVKKDNDEDSNEESVEDSWDLTKSKKVDSPNSPDSPNSSDSSDSPNSSDLKNCNTFNNEVFRNIFEAVNMDTDKNKKELLNNLLNNILNN